MTTKSLDDLLEEIQAGEVDQYMVDVNQGKIAGLLGWWWVEDGEQLLGYFPTETEALRYRLAEINRRLNG